MSDPTNKICKIVTDILNPIAKSGQSFVEKSYDLKQFLGNLNVNEYDIQALFGIVTLYTSIPSQKHWSVYGKSCSVALVHQYKQIGRQRILRSYRKFVWKHI